VSPPSEPVELGLFEGKDIGGTYNVEDEELSLESDDDAEI